MPTGVYLRHSYPLPYCPNCGGYIEFGFTVAGRRAWFCVNIQCKWYDQAVVAVYFGTTDDLSHYRAWLWSIRTRAGRERSEKYGKES